jgi:hypothetical protein
MGYNKNLLLREENNPSDVNVIRSNAKDENRFKKDKKIPVHVFYRELFDTAKGWSNISKDLEKFLSECITNRNAIAKTKKKKNKTEMKKSGELVNKSVEALID